MCDHLNEPDYTALAILEANERMGAALAMIYRRWPHIQAEVAAYMADEANWRG